VFLVQVVKGKQVKQTVGPMPEREAKAHAQRIADALGSKAQVFLLPVKANEGGAHPSVSVSAHDANLDAARYPSIFNDTNDDGLPDIDDAFGPLSHEGPPIQTEETRLSAVFANVLKVREAYQQQVETFLAELASEFPGRQMSGRAKTPYSLVQKLFRSYVFDPNDPKAVFKRAKKEGDALMLKDFAGTSIYAKDKRDLDQIVAYIDAHHGGENLIEKEDKYADEDAAAPGNRKGYVAVHYIFLRHGIPVELMVKTERIVKLGQASHTPMKNKTLDIPAYLRWTDLVRRADLGDAEAAAQVDPMLNSVEGIENIANQITLRRNPSSSRSRWSDNDFADLADYTENPHRGHVEAEWQHNPAAAMMAAGRAALPLLRRLASSPTAQHLASQAASGALAAAGRRTNGRKKAPMRPLADYIPWRYRGRVIGDASYVESYNLDRREIEEIKVYLEGNGFTVSVETKDAGDTYGSRTVIRAIPVRPNIGGTGGLGQGGFMGSDTVAALRGGFASGTLGSSGYRVGGSAAEEGYFARQDKLALEKLREKHAMRTNRAVATDDGEVDVDPLPFAPDRYFVGGVDVPLALIKPIRARRKGIVNANTFMRQAYEGQAERRGPVTLAEVGDPHDVRNRYVLLDGNSTYANAAMSGWPTIRATVVDTPAGMLPNPRSRKTPAQLRREAAGAMHQGDVEKCWYLHGAADRAEGLRMDRDQADDELYGSDYQNGYKGRSFDAE